MLTNFSIIFIVTMLFAFIFKKMRLPELLGMIFAGILLGPLFSKFGTPYSQIISTQIYSISVELRTAALIVILIRAGLGINKETLNKIGVAAFKMSFIPCLCEGLVVLISVHYLLGWSLVVSGIMAFIIAAVSPAVVVPEMLRLKESGFGKKREVPTLVMAGASIDDVFAITIFGVFLGVATGKQQSIVKIAAGVPLGIIAGILLGCLLGFGLLYFFKKYRVRDTKKVIIFMVIAILFHDLSELPNIKNMIPIASLLGIMAMGFILLEKHGELANRLSKKFNKVWVFAEIILFVLIGAKVDLDKALNSDILYSGLLIIFIALIARTAGVLLALLGSKLNKRERLFCAFAYLPKATVQAAIGAIPLSMGVAEGKDILSIAVLCIIITAPLGAILIKYSAPKLLDV
jgi:NhaP-type Na+/H+ or K+/H+ antiporter